MISGSHITKNISVTGIDEALAHAIFTFDVDRLLGQPGPSANVLIAESPVIIKRDAQIFETKALKIN